MRNCHEVSQLNCFLNIIDFIKSDLLLPKSLETSGGSRTKENGNSTADVYCQTVS